MLFLLLTRNTLFGRIRFKTQKVVHWKWSMMPRLIWIWRIQWWHSLFLFLTEISFFGQFLPKNQNYLLKLEFWNLEPRPIEYHLIFIFFFVRLEIPFLSLGWIYPQRLGASGFSCFFPLGLGQFRMLLNRKAQKQIVHTIWKTLQKLFERGNQLWKTCFFATR